MQPVKDSANMEDVCGISFDNLDFNLVEATLQSIETRTLTPIIKEELKLKIQSKRLAAGKAELPKSVFKEPEKCELTAEEQKKRDFRRERNRVAAAKCRNKRKYQGENLKTMLAETQLKNNSLKWQVEELEREKDTILKKIKLLHGVCPQPTSTEPSPSTCHKPAWIHSPPPSPIPPASSPSASSPSASSDFMFTAPSPASSSTSRHFKSPVPLSELQFSPVPQLPSPLTTLPESPSPIRQPLSSIPLDSLPPPPQYLESPSVSPAPFTSAVERATSPAASFDMKYEDMPSTSTGIYEQVPRRYSDDTPRNLVAKACQPRRFSVDSHDFNNITDYSHLFSNQGTMIAQTALFHQTSMHSEMFAEDLAMNEPNMLIQADNQINKPHDMDFDLLSDEEFFRFENETLPFDRYQSANQSNTMQENPSGQAVSTDGVNPVFSVSNTTKVFETLETEKICQEGDEHIRQEDGSTIVNCLLDILPVFEDEAMVPVYDPPGPTSPTFY